MRAARRRGRPVEHRLGEDIAAICALSRANATTSPDDLGGLLGVPVARAREIIASLSTETVDDTSADDVVGPIVPLCDVGDGAAVRRLTPLGGARCPALRLTVEQARACALALDRVGIARGSGLRSAIEASFFPDPHREGAEADAAGRDDAPDTGVTDAAGRDDARNAGRADGAGADGSDAADVAATNRNVDGAAPNPSLPALMACATSLSEATDGDEAGTVRARVVAFNYRGANDVIKRSRRFVPLDLRVQDDVWAADGFDLDARATRSFHVALMEDSRVTERVVEVPLGCVERPDGGTVQLSCTPEATRVVLGWDGARVVGQHGDLTEVEVPYYRGDWLPRHVLALGGDVTHTSRRLAREMGDVARGDLALARRLLR